MRAAGRPPLTGPASGATLHTRVPGRRARFSPDPPGLQGFLLGRFVAPDLGRLAREWSTVDLERAIRHGVRPDGRSTLAMPSSMFQGLSDEDFGKLLAFLESREPDTGLEREVRLGPMARLLLIREVFTPQAEEIDRDRPHPPPLWRSWRATIPTPSPGSWRPGSRPATGSWG